MITAAVIAFREFLEAFLIVGVFMGISRKMKLGRELEIGLAAALGFAISLLLAILTFTFGDSARGILTEERAEVLESYLLIFAGCFIAYVVFSLHDVLRKNRGGTLLKAHSQLAVNRFDISLFLTIVMLVVREGFEIALFTASTSLFSEFFQNFVGLMIGFAGATSIGLLTFFSFIRFPIGKVFKATQYVIMLLGASLVQNGITELLEHSFNIHISDILQLPFGFLPDKHTVTGHFIRSFTGIDQEFSLVRLALMVVYIGIVYLLFLRKPHVQTTR